MYAGQSLSYVTTEVSSDITTLLGLWSRKFVWILISLVQNQIW